MKPVLFISHSSADKARAEQLVQALKAGGEVNAAFDVRDLRQGEEYAPQLFHWLARCHGGVLLLSSEVMKNPAWVLQEATVLRARQRVEGTAFRLFVVIDEEVLEHAVWKQWFAPLKLDALQRVKLVQTDAAAGARATFTAAELQRIVDAVHAGAAGLPAAAEDFHSRLALRIEADLAPVLSHALLSQRLTDGLDEADAEWEALIGGGQRLPQIVARRLCRGEFGKFSGMVSLFNAFKVLPTSRHPELESLHGTLASGWVPLPIGAQVANALATMIETGGPAPADAPPFNLVLLPVNGQRHADVALKVAQRHVLPYQEIGWWCSVAEGNEGEQALRTRVARTLCQTMALPESRSEQSLIDTVAADLGHDHFGVPTFMHLAASSSLDHVLPVVRRFWPVLFIVTTTPACARELAARHGLAVMGYPPALPPEDHCLEEADRALNVLRARPAAPA